MLIIRFLRKFVLEIYMNNSDNYICRNRTFFDIFTQIDTSLKVEIGTLLNLVLCNFFEK